MIQWKAQLSKSICVSFGAVRDIRGKNLDLAEGNDFWLEFERKIRKIQGSRSRLRFRFVQPALIYAWLVSSRSWVRDIGVYAYVSDQLCFLMFVWCF